MTHLSLSRAGFFEPGLLFSVSGKPRRYSEDYHGRKWPGDTCWYGDDIRRTVYQVDDPLYLNHEYVTGSVAP